HALLALAANLIDQGKPAEAEIVMRQALADSPAPEMEAQFQLQLSAALRRQRKDQAALAACDAAQHVAPAFPQVVLHRADCLQNLGRNEEAMDIYRSLL